MIEPVVRGHPTNACFRCGRTDQEVKLGYSKFNNGWLCDSCAKGTDTEGVTPQTAPTAVKRDGPSPAATSQASAAAPPQGEPPA